MITLEVGTKDVCKAQYVLSAYFGLLKMTPYQLNDDQIRDYMRQSATLIEKSLHGVRILADGFVPFPKNEDARSQLVDSAMKMQAALADELDAMRKVLENAAFMAMFG